MNNLKINLLGVLSLLIILSIYFLNQKNNEIELKQELVENIAPIKKELIINNLELDLKNNVKSKKNKIIKRNIQSNELSLKNKKEIENLKKETITNKEKIEKSSQKRPTSLDQLKKDLSDNKNKFKFSKNSKIDYLQNEKSDPFSKPLIPQEIDRIKEKALKYEPIPISSDDVVTLKTNRGTMKLKLFSKIAPKHCYNFKKLANSGYYDGTTFHRIIPNFMIQGGDILSRDGSKKNDGQGGPGWTVEAEFNNVKHRRGVLSMARSSDPNSAGSQFFICDADAPHLDGKYTAFGEVIDNLDVIDKIVNAPTEYSETKKLCVSAIPKGSIPKEWVQLIDPKTRKPLYAKIPKSDSADSFKYEMTSRLRDNNPTYPVRILSIRID